MQYQVDMAHFAALLRERRGRRSLRAIARECGISVSTLSRIEIGRERINLPTFLALCAWLQVHPADLITDTTVAEFMPPPTLAESVAYALAPLDPALREAFLTIIDRIDHREAHDD